MECYLAGNAVLKGMYSQNNEEQFILSHFQGRGGRFLDIGAYDGKTFSNTLALAERGWTGVCVEPSPSVFVLLLQLHGRNPGVVLLNAAVALSPGFTTFYDSGGDAISSTVEAHVRKWEIGYKTAKFTPYEVYAVALSDLFDRYGFGFDFINVDVEGNSFNLFERLPFARLDRTTCICVEHDDRAQAVVEIGSKHGFRLLTSNAENVILGR